jgi:hypothetical protein
LSAGTPGLDVFGQHVEATRHELTGRAHAGKGRGPVNLDLAGFA